MKKAKWILPALALLLILTAGIDSALAYFTAHTESLGGYTIHLGDHEEITESFSGWTKRVKVTSRPGSEPVFVRARAFCGSEYTLRYLPSDGWSEAADGYCYYGGILRGGESSTELLVKIEGVPDDPEVNDSFNVVVIYESTPVLYREDGTPYADWSMLLDNGGTP